MGEGYFGETRSQGARVGACVIRPHTITLESLREREDARREALRKFREGLPLTAREERIVAYTPSALGGTGAGCCRCH